MVSREAVVAEALTWEGTPYHHRARVRGAGVDCANLLAAVYRDCGLIPDLDLGYYPRDWHQHRCDEQFLKWLRRFADPVAAALPADVLVFRFGRCISHGGILLDAARILHAWSKAGKVTQGDVDRKPLAGRLHSIWRVRGL